MTKLRLRAACLLATLCCAWVACTLAQTEDAAATVQSAEAAAYRRERYYDPNPCLSDLPDHYSGSLASLDSYCKEHRHQHKEKYYRQHKHGYKEDGYWDDEGDYEYNKGKCPSGPQPATYINLLRSNDTVGNGVWGMQLVGVDCWELADLGRMHLSKVIVHMLTPEMCERTVSKSCSQLC